MSITPSSSSSSAVIVDPRGDIKLHVGQDENDDHVAFHACSRSLARCSPVFDRMLYGGFYESKENKAADEDWVLDLPNDKPSTMEIFLNITHSNFQKVPKILSIDNLFDLTVCTNYYDSTHLLSLWANAWMTSIEDIVKDANALMPKMLWISWELGYKGQFMDMAHRMVMEWEGPLSTDLGQLLGLQTPIDIIERISSIRTRTIQTLLDIFRDMTEHLIVVDERPRWCQHATWMGHHRCESMILGSITFCLTRADLWPLPDAQHTRYSVQGLYTKLTKLVIHDIGQAHEKPAVDHGQCNPRHFLLDRVRQAMDEIPSPLTEEHIKHFDQQPNKWYA